MEKVDSVESDEFKPEQILTEEKSLLERFTGKAKKIARVMTIVSALSVAPGMVQEVYAQENKSGAKVEQVQSNPENLTEASTWASEIVEKAKADMSEIKTAKDADALLGDYLVQFLNKWRFLNKNISKDVNKNLDKRGYTKEDTKLILQRSQEMEGILDEIDGKFGADKVSYSRLGRPFLKDIMKDIEWESSYAYKKQQENFKRLDEQLNKK